MEQRRQTREQALRRQGLLEQLPQRYNGSRAYHIGLRGVDSKTFSSFRTAKPINETVVCCDYGNDHEQMLSNGTRRMVSLERERGFHADWSTDDLDAIPNLASFRSLIDESRRGATRESPVVLIPFKNTHSIDGLRGNDVQVCGSPYELVHELDSKVNLPGILRAAGIEPIPGEIVSAGSFSQERYDGLVRAYGGRLVVQLAFGSGGSGTFFTNSMEEISAIFLKYGAGEVKVSRFINGPSLNGQAVVLPTTEGERTVVFGPSFQIIGIPELSDWPTYYCGNDYTGVPAYLGEGGMAQYESIMSGIGDYMAGRGWRGVFGVDLIYSMEEKKVYALEINPRMNSSTSFIHQLLEQQGEPGIGIYHLLSFLADRPVPAGLLPGSLPELSGCHVLVNNKTGSDVTVTGDVRAGVYRLNGSMRLENPGYWSDLSQGDFLVTCGVPQPGTRAENHATLLKVYSMEKALNGTQDALAPRMARAVGGIYNALRLE